MSKIALHPLAASDAAWESQRRRAARYGGAPSDGPETAIPLKSGKDFTLQKIAWLWPGWCAKGKFHILAGAKATGKSTLAFDLMARTTISAEWPDNSGLAPLGDVLIWSGEDGIEDTILPRFAAAGGDLARIYPIRDIRVNGKTRPFDPATDIDSLVAMAMQLPELRLAIIDPVVLALPAGADSHKNGGARSGAVHPMTAASRKNASNTPGRGPGRPFANGNAGKPRGARHRATVTVEALLEGQGEAIGKKCAELAAAGDSTALRLAMERIAPVRRGRPVRFTLPALDDAGDLVKALGALLLAVACGELTPDEAGSLSQLVEARRRSIETAELEQRIALLENAAGASR